MFYLLVITENQGFTESVRVLLPEKAYKVHGCAELGKAVSLLKSGLAHICILDADLSNVSGIRSLEAVREEAPSIPVFICSETADAHWEEQAYVKDADFIFHKPLRGPLLKRMLDKHLAQSNPSPSRVPPQSPSPSPGMAPTRADSLSASALEIMRDFSRILSYSLDLKSFVHQFTLKLREVISVNRAAILLRQPGASFPGISSMDEDTHLDCICSIGIEADIFQYFQLNLASGIGGTVSRSGQILKAEYENNLLFPEDHEIRREFELLGCQVAIPIVDRERCLGIALLGGRLTGAQFTDEELQLLFHLMEELGLAVRNNWLHEELSSNHALISDVIAQFKSGCLVVSPDLQVLHANPALLDFLQKGSGGKIEFSDLPTRIASRLYEVAQKGEALEPFMFDDFPNDERIYRISIFPLQMRRLGSGTAVMLLVEDFTQIENAKKIELEAQNAQTISLIAERFAHEIRNALVPLSTHHQLLDSDFSKEGFRDSLERTMGRQISRISRFADQMLLLSRSRNGTNESTSLKNLITKAFEEARSFSGKCGSLRWNSGFQDCEVRGDLSALKYAYMEILLNGLQSENDEVNITISSQFRRENDHAQFALVDFTDDGQGFSEEAAEEALKPFFTTRNVGIGLGLTVAEKILRAHGGSLEIIRNHQRANGVRTIIPLL